MTATLPSSPFLGHGSPMNAIEDNRYTRAWEQFGASFERPRAIVAVSAHWYVRGVAVTAMERPRTIHDFYGFPRELYAVEYPAPGDPALARRIASLLAPEPVALDEGWGLDHGTWSVLVHAFANADVPVVQLAVDASKTPQQHWDLAAKLAPLRDEGVLLIGLGNVVHNLRLAQFAAEDFGFDWAVAFDREIAAALHERDAGRLVHYDDLPGGRLAVPTPEHYLPLLYAAAVARPDERATTVVEGMEAGSLSMRSVAFTRSA